MAAGFSGRVKCESPDLSANTQNQSINVFFLNTLNEGVGEMVRHC